MIDTIIACTIKEATSQNQKWNNENTEQPARVFNACLLGWKREGEMGEDDYTLPLPMDIWNIVFQYVRCFNIFKGIVR